MKRLIVTSSQYSKIYMYEGYRSALMQDIDKLKNSLMESTAQGKDALLESYLKKLMENGLEFSIPSVAVEGGCKLKMSPFAIMEAVNKSGASKATLGKMPELICKECLKTDEFLTEEMLEEGVFNMLNTILRGKKGESLKKAIISLVLAGKLAMISTTVLASTANKLDSTIDLDKFKTEIEAAKSKTDKKDGGDSKGLTPEAKKSQLDVLSTSKIEMENGTVVNFNYDGSLDSFDEMNGDNYPQFKPGTPEANNLKMAFERANKTGEGIVKGKCSFNKFGKTTVFSGTFVLANGLWYKFDMPKFSEFEFDGIPTQSGISTEWPEDKSKGGETMVKDKPHLKYDDFTGLAQGAQERYNHLVKTGQKPSGTYMNYLTNFMKTNDKRLSHLTDQQIADLFKDGFKVNMEMVPAK
jgi:hypothetical protein